MTPLALPELVRSEPWQELEQQVAVRAPAAQVLSAFRSLRPLLGELHLPPALFDQIELGLSTGSWEGALSEFLRCRKRRLNFYLGPLRWSDTQAMELGLALLQESQATGFLASLEELLPELGPLLFGVDSRPSHLGLELYDVVRGVGVPVPVAAGVGLFEPGGCAPRGEHRLLRRMAVPLNVLRARWSLLVSGLAPNALRFDGAPPRFTSASPQDLDRAMVLSRALEIFLRQRHWLPAWSGEALLTQWLTDAAVIMALGALEKKLGEVSRLCREMLLAERIAESAHPSAGRRWLELLVTGGLDIETRGLLATIQQILAEFYEADPGEPDIAAGHTLLARFEGNQERVGHFTQGLPPLPGFLDAALLLGRDAG